MSIKLPIQGVAMTATGAVKPVNTVLPTVNVTNVNQDNGNGFQATSGTGTWSPTPTGYLYQWESRPSGPFSFSPIVGQTSQSITVGIVEATDIRCGVRAVNGSLVSEVAHGPISQDNIYIP